MLRPITSLAAAGLVSASTAGAAVPAAELDVPFATIEQGIETGITEGGYRVFRSAFDFDTFWNEHKSYMDLMPQVPAINWSHEMVVAVFFGPEGGVDSSIEIDQVDVLGVAMFAHVDQEFLPSALPILANPYHIVKIARHDVPVVFPDFDLEPRVIETGFTQDAILPDANVVIENAETWNAVWSRLHNEDVRAPQIDFETHIVLGASAGMVPSPAHRIEVSWAEVANVRELDAAIAVVENILPGGPSITLPGYAYQLVLMQRPMNPLHVLEITQVERGDN